jgi:hypothetical protein
MITHAMTVHLLCIAGATALIVLVTLLPFMPGSYDPLSVPLSAMARVSGFAGLLFVPVGALWTASAYWPRLSERDYAFAVTALIVWSIVSGILSMAAFALVGLLLGVVTLALAAYAVFSMRRWIATLRTARPARRRAPALYVLIVPLAVFLVQQALVPRAVEFSRDRAIRNAALLIADIERHRTARGTYPSSLLSVWKDYSPSVIGIERYHYEPSRDAYNLLFEQPAADLATREFVVYNPRDEQVATGHAMDLLEYSIEQLERRRGYFAVHQTPHAHWKYFWFD